jgi:hypothetical protein
VYLFCLGTGEITNNLCLRVVFDNRHVPVDPVVDPQILAFLQFQWFRVLGFGFGAESSDPCVSAISRV